MLLNLKNLRITLAINTWLLLSVILLFYQQPQALAQELEIKGIELVQPTEDKNNSEIINNNEIVEQPEDNGNILDEINQDLEETVDKVIGGIFDNLPDIGGFFGGLEEIVGDFINSKIPDVDKIIELIFSSGSEGEAELPSKEQSEKLESSPESYSISETEADAVVREVLVEIVESSTLSEEGQTKLKETAVFVQQTVEESVNLGEDSQNRDVSQQILQNLSQQEAISATRQGVIVQQNQQAQVDRAISNILNAQQAEELNAINTAKRREEIGTTNLTVRQWGMIRLPVNPIEEDDI